MFKRFLVSFLCVAMLVSNGYAVRSDLIRANLVPKVDDAQDIGSSSLQWKSGYFDGTLTTDVLTVDETSTLTGVATFTAQPVFNGGIDINEDVDIDFDAGDEEFNVTISSGQTTADAATFTIYSSTGDVVGQEWLLRLRYKDTADADADFLVCEDADGTDKLSINNDGNTTIGGTLGVTGATTLSSTLGVSGNITATNYQITLSTITKDSSDFSIQQTTTTFVGSISILSLTEAQLKAYTPTSAGEMFYDSTNAAIVLSTGTTVGSFGQVISGATVCTGW